MTFLHTVTSKEGVQISSIRKLKLMKKKLYHLAQHHKTANNFIFHLLPKFGQKKYELGTCKIGRDFTDID